jgi:hypothetical protein
MYTWPDIRENTLNLRARDNLREKTSYAIQSQYSASRKILALAANYQRGLNPHRDVDLFYTKMFDLARAQGVGLDNWGLILGMGREIPALDNSASLLLDDENYRLLLLYKALANISPATVQGLNRLLRALVDTGISGLPQAAYVLEVDTMVIRWVFEDFLNPIQAAVFKAAGTLARGAGVGWELYAVQPDLVFGFAGDGWQPFGQAAFAPDNALLHENF